MIKFRNSNWWLFKLTTKLKNYNLRDISNGIKYLSDVSKLKSIKQEYCNSIDTLVTKFSNFLII